MGTSFGMFLGNRAEVLRVVFPSFYAVYEQFLDVTNQCASALLILFRKTLLDLMTGLKILFLEVKLLIF